MPSPRGSDGSIRAPRQLESRGGPEGRPAKQKAGLDESGLEFPELIVPQKNRTGLLAMRSCSSAEQPAFVATLTGAALGFTRLFASM